MGRRTTCALVGSLVLLLAGCGGAPASTPRDSTAASPRPTADASSGASSPAATPTRTGTPPASGGDVPDGVPRTVTDAQRLIATYGRGFANPVRGDRVATVDGTTCRLSGVPLCRVGEGIAVTGYCPPPAEAEVVAVVLAHERATPVCGGVPLPSGSVRAASRRLPNGQVTDLGRAMRCAGVRAGVLCVSRSGTAGFFLSLDGYRVLR